MGSARAGRGAGKEVGQIWSLTCKLMTVTEQSSPRLNSRRLDLVSQRVVALLRPPSRLGYRPAPGPSNHIVASGGKVITAEYSKPCAGTFSVLMLFTVPKPPPQ